MLRYITKTLHLKLQGKSDYEIEVALRSDLEQEMFLDEETKNHIIGECLK